MVVHTFNLSTRAAKAGRYQIRVQGQPALHSEFQDSHSYVEIQSQKCKRNKGNQRIKESFTGESRMTKANRYKPNSKTHVLSFPSKQPTFST